MPEKGLSLNIPDKSDHSQVEDTAVMLLFAGFDGRSSSEQVIM